MSRMQLDQLHADAPTYVHGHSVGGTNPSLLRAMGSGTSVLAYDVDFNREVLGADGVYLSIPEGLRGLIDDAEHSASQFRELGQRLQRRAEQSYRIHPRVVHGLSTATGHTFQRID